MISGQGSLKTVLHIGTEKTGTTTLQRFLSENRRALRARGIAFTSSCGMQNNRDIAAYAIRDLEFNDGHLIQLGIRDLDGKQAFRASVNERFGEEITNLRPTSHTVIISSEHLQSRLTTPGELETLKTFLQLHGLEVTTVLVYLRDPAATIWSLYSTALRNGSTAEPPTSPKYTHWKHICDHRKTLMMWGQVFGAQTVVPRIYGHGEFEGGSLIADFCKHVGIGEVGSLVVPADRNQALSSHGQVLYRLINRVFPWERVRKRAAIVVRLSDKISRQPATIPAELIQSCAEHFRDSNEWVRSSYFPERPALFR